MIFLASASKFVHCKEQEKILDSVREAPCPGPTRLRGCVAFVPPDQVISRDSLCTSNRDVKQSPATIVSVTA